MGRALYPGLRNYRLNTLCAKFNIRLEQHHRAVHDADATGQLLWKMVSDCLDRGLTRLDELNDSAGERDLTRIRPFHAVILVKNETGLKNLYKLISLSHLKYFHRVPRIPRSELVKHRDGLIIGSGCEQGELFEAALQKSHKMLKRLPAFMII